MNILLAEHDRDMLMTYKKLLTVEGFNVTAVFDGVQAVEALSSAKFDLVVADRRLPLIKPEELQKRITELSIPSLVLIYQRITPQILLENTGADSYMSYPFFPSEFTIRVRQIIERSKSDSQLNINGLTIYEKSFRCENGMHFTNEEIEIIKRVLAEKPVNTHGISPYINAVNNRLEKLKSSSRLRYVPDKGYRLVKNYE